MQKEFQDPLRRIAIIVCTLVGLAALCSAINDYKEIGLIPTILYLLITWIILFMSICLTQLDCIERDDDTLNWPKDRK